MGRRALGHIAPACSPPLPHPRAAPIFRRTESPPPPSSSCPPLFPSRSYNYDEEPLEERVGKYAREHLIIREDEEMALPGAGAMGGAGAGGPYHHEPYD